MKLQKKNDYYLVDNSGHTIATTDKVILKKIKSISKLSKQNCDEIFGVINIIDLAERNSKHSEEDYIEGFNKAMEFNKDKLFTEADMIKFADDVYKLRKENKIFEGMPKLLQSLQQPKVIEVEIEMEPCYYDQSLGAFSTSYTEDKPKEQPKLDKNGCLILKRHYISQNNKD